MDPDGQLRNLRDFLLVYNRMTEICFQRCTSNFNYRNLTMEEERCVDSCAGKLIRTNHRLMGTYVQLMPAMVQKRMQEMESKAAEAAKAEAAAQGGALALENPSAAMTDTQPVPPLTPGIPAASSPVEMPPAAADHASTSGFAKTSIAPNYPSEIKSSPLVFEQATQAPETGKLPIPFMSTNEASSSAVSPVMNNTQTFTTDSLQGQITVPSVMSPKGGVGSISSAVEKLDLKPSCVTATSVSETRSTGGAGQNSQTPS